MCAPTPAAAQRGTVNAQPPEDIKAFIEPYAQLFKNGQRSPVLRNPSQEQKAHRRQSPNDLYNRYGFPGHLEGYGGFGGFEVNFLPDYKAMHEAGYNIICHDLRNHGISDTGCGGMCGALGYYEARDIVGSLQYARSRAETKDNSIGLMSRCMGGNATLHAMTLFPEHFKGIKAMILLQAVSGHAFVEKGAKDRGLDVDLTIAAFDKRIHDLTGFHLADLTPIPHGKNVTCPTLFAQIRKDSLIDTKDSQEIFDALSSKEKEPI
ncbi:alpha/beta-hydrolase [Hortaea werneckii]|nr:alpha/beta-hydrolase [Hortaea werneckii]